MRSGLRVPQHLSPDKDGLTMWWRHHHNTKHGDDDQAAQWYTDDRSNKTVTVVALGLQWHDTDDMGMMMMRRYAHTPSFFILLTSYSKLEPPWGAPMPFGLDDNHTAVAPQHNWHMPKLYAQFLVGLLMRHWQDGGLSGQMNMQLPPHNLLQSRWNLEFQLYLQSGGMSTMTFSVSIGIAINLYQYKLTRIKNNYRKSQKIELTWMAENREEWMGIHVLCSFWLISTNFAWLDWG